MLVRIKMRGDGCLLKRFLGNWASGIAFLADIRAPYRTQRSGGGGEGMIVKTQKARGVREGGTKESCTAKSGRAKRDAKGRAKSWKGILDGT